MLEIFFFQSDARITDADPYDTDQLKKMMKMIYESKSVSMTNLFT
jgi:hypothetical protein